MDLHTPAAGGPDGPVGAVADDHVADDDALAVDEVDRVGPHLLHLVGVAVVRDDEVPAAAVDGAPTRDGDA